MRAHRGSDQMRRSVAVEAARLMSESGIRDFQMAKRKAAERLGANEKSQLPNNSEIEERLARISAPLSGATNIREPCAASAKKRATR